MGVRDSKLPDAAAVAKERPRRLGLRLGAAEEEEVEEEERVPRQKRTKVTGNPLYLVVLSSARL